MYNKITPFILTCILSAFLLSACNSTNGSLDVTKPLDSMEGNRRDKNAYLETAANEDLKAGRYADAANAYRKIYNELSYSDSDVTANYAMSLRKSGHPERAKKLLLPYFSPAQGNQAANTPDNGGVAHVSAALLEEYAAVNIDLKDFAAAEKALHDLMTAPGAEKFHADAAYMTGVVLDHSGNYKGAVTAFNDALNSGGDQSSAICGMALALAHQGNFNQAIDVLNRALLAADDKQPVARTLKAVRALKADGAKKKPS